MIVGGPIRKFADESFLLPALFGTSQTIRQENSTALANRSITNRTADYGSDRSGISQCEQPERLDSTVHFGGKKKTHRCPLNLPTEIELILGEGKHLFPCLGRQTKPLKQQRKRTDKKRILPVTIKP